MKQHSSYFIAFTFWRDIHNQFRTKTCKKASWTLSKNLFYPICECILLLEKIQWSRECFFIEEFKKGDLFLSAMSLRRTSKECKQRIPLKKKFPQKVLPKKNPPKKFLPKKSSQKYPSKNFLPKNSYQKFLQKKSSK